MKDEDYIKKGVELADGWSLWSNGISLPNGNLRLFIDPIIGTMKLEQYWLDALVAQLKRQVDSVDGNSVAEYKRSTQVFFEFVFIKRKGNNRTMNTLKAIVDFAESNGGKLG